MAQKKKKGGFFSGLSSAVEGLASSIDKAAKDVSHDVANITTNPLDHLRPGNIITITAKSCFKSLTVDPSGVVLCNGHPNQLNNLSGQFEVVASQYSTRAFKLRNVAYPQFHLAIVNGYFVGNGQGGPECDFCGHRGSSNSSIDLQEFCSFESAMSPGSHIGVLQTGQFTEPAKTVPHGNNIGLFRVKYIKYNKPPPPPQAPVPGQGTPIPYYPAPGTAQQPPPQGYPGQQPQQEYPGQPPPQEYPGQQPPQEYPGQQPPQGGYEPPPQYSNPPPASQPTNEKQGVDEKQEYPPPTAPPQN